MIPVCVFFFYKQKTAYEMRISDWSSDVCSSDLARLYPHAPRRAHDRRPGGGGGDRPHPYRRGAELSAAGPAQLMSGPIKSCPEIGRASCRERVCQYV